MKGQLTKSIAATFAALAFVASPAVADEDDFEVPPYVGVYQPQDRDERGLWSMFDESERSLRDADAIVRDPDLNQFVRSVFCRTVGDDRCGSVRIYIVRMPAFNASMAPNGTMLVYSGLLLRVRSEAELASVLGHEFAHFELRHSLLGYRNRRKGSDLLAWTTLLGAVASTYGNHSMGQTYGDQLAILGGIYRYERNQERDADLLGFGYMARAGFRPSAASEVWRSVMTEADRTAADRGRRSRRYDGVAFFASHPASLERADTLSALANRVPGGEYDGLSSYREVMAPWVPVFLADELALNDFGGTDYLISRIAGDDYTADLLFARGELYRTRGHPRDLLSAADFYGQALDLDPAKAEAWRGLGLSLLRGGQNEEGSKALRAYLDQVPDAADAPMLRTLVQD